MDKSNWCLYKALKPYVPKFLVQEGTLDALKTETNTKLATNPLPTIVSCLQGNAMAVMAQICGSNQCLA